MCVKQVAATTTVYAKQFHACNNNEMRKKTKMVLLQDNMHQNDNKHSLKSRRQQSYKEKDKK